MTGFRRAPAATVAAILAACAAATAANAHGASRGMHLHLTPDSAPPGATIVVDVDAASPMRNLKVAFVGKDPVAIVPKTPAKHLSVTLVVPAVAASTINVVAEAEATTGKVVRASAIVKVVQAAREAVAH